MAVSSDSLRLALGEEVNPGTAPSGSYALIRTTGEGITYEVTTTQSDEMGGLNRGVKDNILTGATVTGSINFELSKHIALEELMSAALGNDWGADPLGVPNSDGNNVYDASNFRSFSIEKRFTLDEDPAKYSWQLFTGCMVDTMNISITPNEPITGSFGFIGETVTTVTGTGTSGDAGSTYLAAGNKPVMTAPLVTGIELLSPAGIDDITGLPIGTPVDWTTNGCFTGLDLSFNNNGRGIQCIGTLGNSETVLGRFEVTATGSFYYAGDEPLDALVDQTEYTLRVVISDADADSYSFLCPRIKLSSTSVLASGTNTDVMAELGIAVLEYQGDNGLYALTSYITRNTAATS